MMRLPFTLLSSLVLILLCTEVAAQQSRFGAHYGYGGFFNLHASNTKKARPSDGSVLGLWYQLDNGDEALGFRATLGWRHNDSRISVANNAAPTAGEMYIHNNQESIELKLQCMLPLNQKNRIAFGIGPRMVTHSSFNVEYRSKSNKITYEEHLPLSATTADLNEINTTLCLSWLHEFTKRIGFCLNIDQDMLPGYNDAVSFGIFSPVYPAEVNFIHTSVNASLMVGFR